MRDLVGALRWSCQTPSPCVSCRFNYVLNTSL
nr:MAG TPA: hypothetical protein [Bacteriophage sp.]